MIPLNKVIKIHNPILRGCNPDPCICRVGENFYIATSTFEWYPGVQIFLSKDLCNWELVARPLIEPEFLDLRGCQASGGIWAPSLSYKDGYFFLVYTIVHQFEKSLINPGFKDTLNYITTAKQVEGPWTHPVFLNASGFDPSLFHDDDGHSYLLNMRWDYRPGKNNFSGIVCQEYDISAQQLIGKPRIISYGTSLGYTEGPHIYKRKGWYYLVFAEGGTSYAHSVIISRSRNIYGPYELHPQTPFLSAVKDRSELIKRLMENIDPLPACNPGLQKTGHASFCPLDNDTWAMVYLCSRPIAGTWRCPLGRETALKLITWRDDEWPILLDEPSYEEKPINNKYHWETDFDTVDLQKDALQLLRFNWLTPNCLKKRPSWLSIPGGESVSSRWQYLIARRIEHFRWKAEAKMDFHPDTFQQMAGLVVRYDEKNQYYLAVSYDEEIKSSTVAVYSFNRQHFSMSPISFIKPYKTITLSAQCDGRWIEFICSTDSLFFQKFGPFDFSLLSDDYVQPLGFTGSFIGITCNDLSGKRRTADFDYFKYCSY